MAVIEAGPVATTAFWVTVAVWVIGERFLTARDAVRRVRKGGSQDAGSVLWIVVGVVGGVLGALGLAAAGVSRLAHPAPWLVAGFAVAWSGLLLRGWSVVTLGKSFTTTVIVKQGQDVVSSGPYRLVRHPSYLGLLLIMLGFGLALGDLASILVIVVLPAIGLVKRITVEEAAMQAGLGDRYTSYAEGRSRLIPGIW